MERLFLIRHGETDGTADKKFMGNIDLSLNRKGRIEVAFLANRLKREKIRAFYTSPLKRTMETATILSQFHNAPLRRKKGFEEINFGRWEGLTLGEIYERDRYLCQKWFNEVENFVMPDGESVRSMQKRVITTWKGIYSRHRKGTVAIISHGGPIRILLCHLLKLDLTFFWKIRLDTSSLTVLNFFKGFTTLSLLNDTSHIFCQNFIAPWYN